MNKPTVTTPLVTAKFLCISALLACVGLSTLSSCGITEVNYSIKGETIVLSGNEDKHLLKQPAQINAVYGYDEHGIRVNYVEGVDYSVDYIAGSVRRTEKTRIPDYRQHKTDFNPDGSFSFISENGKRNPELNVTYLVYVDYEFVSGRVDIASRASYLSDGVRSKLINGNPVRIALVGDSIAGAAQTVSQYYYNDSISSSFLGMLCDELRSIYGCEVEPVLYSRGGGKLFVFAPEHRRYSR